jgi:hypothetical protein
VFSSHRDNIWGPLVRHECLATNVLSIPEGIVEHWTVVHPACASHLYDVIAWAGFIGAWKGGCFGGSSWVKGPVFRHLSTRSHNDSYHVFSAPTMKTDSCKLQWRISYVVLISKSLSRSQWESKASDPWPYWSYVLSLSSSHIGTHALILLLEPHTSRFWVSILG